MPCRSSLLGAGLIGLLCGCAATHTAAVGQAETLVMQDPSSADGWVALGDAYRKGKREQEAAQAYARALSIDPDHSAAREALSRAGGGVLTELEREALANPNDDELWGDVGDEYAMRGNTERALHFYLYALRLDPSDGEWQRKVAETGGIDEIQELISLDEQDDESLGDMADMLRAADREEQACAYYARANELDPGDSEWIEGLRPCPQVPVGGEGDYGVSMGGALGAPFDHGGGGPTLLDRGRQALAVGAADQARTYFERALLENPGDREALLGVMALTQKTAVEVLEQLAERTPDNDEVFGDLADAYAAEGRFREAIEAYGTANRLDPDDSEWTGKLAILVHAVPEGERP